MKTLSKFLTCLLILLVAGFLSVMFSAPKISEKTGSQTPQINQKLKIGATIFALYDIAKNIGGDKIEVISLLPPGANPHTFEPMPKNLENAIGVTHIFKIGYGADDWADRISNALNNIEIHDVSKNIALRQVGSSTDPHYWLTLQNGSIIAKNIADILIAADPENRNYYLSRLRNHQRQLLNEDNEIKAKFARLKNISIITFHDAFFYFADHYGLQIAGVFEPAPGKEPTPDDLVNFIKNIRDKNIKVIFYEPEFSPTEIQQVARDTGVTLEVLNPIEGMINPSDTYIGLMNMNADKILNSLEK